MSNEADSDDYRSSDDEDYVPDPIEADVDDEPSGDECDEVTANDEAVMSGGRGKRNKKGKSRDDTTILKKASCANELSEEKKAEVDAFFEAMMAESGTPVKNSQTSANDLSTNEYVPCSSTSKSESTKVKITETFDFAGEEIKVEKEVSVEEARAHEEKGLKGETTKKTTHKRIGLGEALTLISKKPKMSVLDKSNLDWQTFKDHAKIGEELATHNRGKGGFIEKQQFLLNADLMQFEKEREMREILRRQKD